MQKITVCHFMTTIFFCAIISACNSAEQNNAQNNLAEKTSSMNDSKVSLNLLYSSQQCSVKAEKAVVYRNTESLLEDLPAATPVLMNRVGQNTDKDAAKKAIMEALAAFNPSEEQLLLIALGPKPNPAYMAKLGSNVASLSGEELQLDVQISKPEPGKMYPQMIVYPCLILSVNTRQPITSIKF